MSVDSDYGSGGSGYSSPCPAVTTTQVSQQPAPVLYCFVVPPGYHLEFTPVEQLIEPEPSVVLPAEKQAVKPRLTESSTFQRRLIKWSLPPPPLRPNNLPVWSSTL